MMSRRILAVNVFISISLLCIGLAWTQDITGLRNFAAMVGQRMTMECHASNGSSIMKWMLTRPNERKIQIFRKTKDTNMLSQNFAHFGFDVDEHGSGFIYTNSTLLSDAGLYFCYNEKSIQLSAHLIVFDKPICETNYTTDEVATHDNETSSVSAKSVWLRCKANFKGLWSPSVEWTNGCAQDTKKESEKAPVKEDKTEIIHNESVNSTLIVDIEPGQTICFKFKIFFVWKSDTVWVNATNLPNFTYTWDSPVMSVRGDEEEPKIPQQILDASKPNSEGSNNWYVLAIGLLMALVTIGSLITLFVVRSFCVRCNRVRGFERSNVETSNGHTRALERPASGTYDVIPNALPNVYDKIDDIDGRCDFDGKGDDKDEAPQTYRPPPPVARCYSTLSDVSIRTQEPYDALSPYLPMRSPVGTLKSGEVFNPGKIGDNLMEDRMQDYALVSAPCDAKEQSKHDYLAIVGDDDTTVDVCDYIYPDVRDKQQAIAEQGNDYLIPIA